MADKNAKKAPADHAPQGVLGQTYLASGEKMAMRLWQEEPGDAEDKGPHANDYETVGFVIAGQAELHLSDETIELNEGDSWVVPAGAEHTYKVTASFKAVEATSPPARSA